MKSKIPTPHRPCWCYSEKTYAQCCGPFLHLNQTPSDAQALMRSRFTAYRKKAFKYLMNTWHPSTRPEKPPVQGIQDWLSLTIIQTDLGEKESFVEFKATYDHKGTHTHTLHENSHFRYENGQWYYLQGEIRSSDHCHF